MRFKYTTVDEAMQWHRKFLLFPEQIDGEWVWLETVWRRLVRICPPDRLPVFEYSTNINKPSLPTRPPPPPPPRKP